MKQAQVLTDKDCKRVMALVSRSPFAERNRCALQLSWLAGMRVGDVVDAAATYTVPPGEVRHIGPTSLPCGVTRLDLN